MNMDYTSPDNATDSYVFNPTNLQEKKKKLKKMATMQMKAAI